jgi:hypothetical protein
MGRPRKYIDFVWINVHTRLPVELAPLISQWKVCWTGHDGHLSGVIADWCEDHWELLVRACRSQKKARQFVSTMRSRFYDPDYNQSEFNPDLFIA